MDERSNSTKWEKPVPSGEKSTAHSPENFYSGEPESFPYRSPVKILLVIALSIAVCEMAVMFVLGPLLGRSWSLTGIMTDSAALVALLSPVLYFLVLRPAVRHIEKYRRLREALAESEEKYRAVAQTANDAIIVMKGPDGVVVLWNKKAEEMFGYAAGEAIGKDLHRLIAPKRYHEDAYAGMSRFFETGEGAVLGRILEISALRKDGSEFYAELSISALRVGSEWRATGIVRDVSEKKRAEETIRESWKQLMVSQRLATIGELAGGVCHEILNPINIISLQAQTLSRQRSEDADLVERMEKIRAQIQRVVKIVDTLSKFSDRKGAGELKKVRLAAELDSVLSLVEKDFERDNIRIVRDYSQDLPETRIDPDEMRQVFVNIVNNAKYAMRGGGGTLTVSAEEIRVGGPAFLKIKFADTGTGIKKEDLDKIFNPFFSSKPEGQGTGMGLAVAHTLVEKNGGIIAAESEEGRGATLIVNLPL